ncbi:MAG: CPBP family intramembrane glutamic endopeptidase [Myxococcota bacterium]
MEEPERGERRQDAQGGGSTSGGGEEGPARGPRSIVRPGLYFYGAMGIVALLWRMSSPGESILHPSIEAEARAWPLAAAVGVGGLAGLLVVGVSELLTRWTRLGRDLSDLLAESIGPLGRADAWLLAFASGLAEEMFFRGALQAKAGLVVASVCFGAAHFLPRRELVLWSVFAVLIGFGLGGLYLWTGQLAAPIAAHVLVNGINLPRLAARHAAGADPRSGGRD